MPCPPPEDLPNPGIEPRSPTLQVDSLPSKPPGNPINIEVPLLQGNFPTQESNRGLLHIRPIFYQLSYQGRLIFFGGKDQILAQASINSQLDASKLREQESRIFLFSG